MTSRILMSLAAAWMGVTGTLMTFAPQELLAAASIAADPSAVLAAQIAGASFLGFAFMNWMARGNAIGGIYQRPMAIGNFTHFLIAALALLKALPGALTSTGHVVLALIYALFALAFGRLLFFAPRN